MKKPEKDRFDYWAKKLLEKVNAEFESGNGFSLNDVELWMLHTVHGWNMYNDFLYNLVTMDELANDCRYDLLS